MYRSTRVLASMKSWLISMIMIQKNGLERLKIWAVLTAKELALLLMGRFVKLALEPAMVVALCSRAALRLNRVLLKV